MNTYRYRTWQPTKLAQTGLAIKPTGKPGEARSYSNTNYVLAGLALERVTGQRAEGVYNMARSGPAGTLASTAGHLSAFAKALVSGRLLSAEQVERSFVLEGNVTDLRPEVLTSVNAYVNVLQTTAKEGLCAE